MCMCRFLQTTASGIRYIVLQTNKSKGVSSTFRFAFETKKYSENWKEFQEAVNTNDFSPALVCIHCSGVYAHPNRNNNKSTSVMGKHLATCLKYRRFQNRKVATEDFSIHAMLNKDMGPMTTNRLMELILRFIISANLPFLLAENADFSDFVKALAPDCNKPTRKGLVKLLVEKSDEAKATMAETLLNLNAKVHLALDY